jgi:DNA-binding MarR family transcriptional regulator
MARNARTRARPIPLTPTDYERLAEFRYLLRQFLIFSEQAADRAGLTAQQHQALLAIKGFGAAHPTVGELARRLGIKHHSTVGLVDRLIAKSLVRRQAGTRDRRQVMLRLTSQAERRLSRLSAAHRSELERLAPLLQTLLAHFRGGGEKRAR